jgi:hypothetical protein
MFQPCCVDVGGIENAARPRLIATNALFVRRPQILKNPGKSDVGEYADLVDFGSRSFWPKNRIINGPYIKEPTELWPFCPAH